MAKTPKYPNPAFFRTKNNMDWKAQGENLKEVFDIAKDMLLATDWKAFGARQKQGWIDFGKRVAEEAAEIAAMSCAERRELLLKGEKKLGRLYKKGAMATVRREWRGVADTAYDFYEWLRIWGMLLGTFSKDLIPALNSVLHYRWMMSYLCCVGFMDKNTMGQHGAALKMSHLMIYDIFRYVAENLVLQAKGDAKNGNSAELNKKVVLFDEMTMGQLMAGFPDLIGIPYQLFAVLWASASSPAPCRATARLWRPPTCPAASRISRCSICASPSATRTRRPCSAPPRISRPASSSLRSRPAQSGAGMLISPP